VSTAYQKAAILLISEIIEGTDLRIGQLVASVQDDGQRLFYMSDAELAEALTRIAAAQGLEPSVLVTSTGDIIAKEAEENAR
jgi:hypothetical protein